MDRARRQSGAQLAQGNYRQAAAPLLAEGDLQTGNALIQQGAALDAEAQKKQLDFTLNAARALRQVREQGGDVLATYDSYGPAFKQMGVDDAQLGQFRQALEANPEQFLSGVESIVGQQARELSFQKTGDNLLVFEEGNPDPVRQFAAPRQPINVGGVLVDPESYEPILDTREPKYQTIQNSDGSTTLVAIDQPAPVGGGGGGAPTARPAAARGTGSGGGDIASMEQAVLAIPGTVVTSGRRSASQNAALPGAAANSYHLTDQARDFRIPQGMTSAEFAAQVRQRLGPEWEVIDEGNARGGPHVHVEPSGQRSSAPSSRASGQPGMRVVAQGANNGPTPAQAMAEARFNRQDQQIDEQNQRADRVGNAQLRREFNGRDEVREFNTVEAAYNTVQAAARNPSAAGDLSLIFGYMKILDPGSVVREQEFANAQNAGGVPDRVWNLYNRVLSGERLSDRQRRDFVSQAGGLYQTRRQTYDRIADEYRQEAEILGYDPERIAPTRGAGGRERGPRTNAPGLRFNVTEQQLSTRRRLSGSGASPQARLGSGQNPYYINPADPSRSYGNVPSGATYVDPQGRLRQKP
jgi:hypothetical protein